MTEPTYEELEIVARAMCGPDWAVLDQIERNHWLHRAREVKVVADIIYPCAEIDYGVAQAVAEAAIKALDEYRAAEWDKRIQAQMDRFPNTRAYLAESERNEVAEEAPKHKDDF